MKSYQLKLDIFEGPLDLLLFLIKKDEIDICNIPIAQVAQQYMEYMEMMKMLDLDIAGEFLVMASTLIQIKSKMLLPQEKEDVEEELDPRNELAKKLLEYKKFKEAAIHLKKREFERQNLFMHKDDATINEFKNDAEEVFFEATLFDLMEALKDILNRKSDNIVYEVYEPTFTVEEKIITIFDIMRTRNKFRFSEIFKEIKSKAEIIVTFIAILELIKQKKIIAYQENPFDEIEIVKNKENTLLIKEERILK